MNNSLLIQWTFFHHYTVAFAVHVARQKLQSHQILCHNTAIRIFRGVLPRLVTCNNKKKHKCKTKKKSKRNIIPYYNLCVYSLNQSKVAVMLRLASKLYDGKNHQTMRNQNDAAGGSSLPFCYPAWQMALR